jgi:hypothetical protein
MPIFRYFMFVGGALLLLLLAVDYVQPAAPIAQNVATTTSDVPPIRIRSDRQLPDRVVLDTSQRTIPAPAAQTAAVAPPQPAQASEQSASNESNDMSAKARVRETFAQFNPPEQKAVKKADVKPRRRVARARPAQPYYGQPFGQPFGRPMVVAQQPRFGFFNQTW